MNIADQYRELIKRYSVLIKIGRDAVQLSLPLFCVSDGICRLRYTVIINRRQEYRGQIYIDLTPEQIADKHKAAEIAAKCLQSTLNRELPEYGEYWNGTLLTDIAPILEERYKITEGRYYE